MSATAPEQRAWQQPRSKPTASGVQKPNRSTNGQLSSTSSAPLAAPAKPATPAVGSVWATKAQERKSNAAQQKTVATPASSSTREGDKKASAGTNATTASLPAAGSSTTSHVPVNNFNANEVREFLKKGSKEPTYKVEGGPKGGSAWGSKPQNTSNGQNFFAQLDKQTTALKK